LRAYHALLVKRRTREKAEFVTAVQLGTRGDAREIKKVLRKWLAV
jgi:hypothetical protein